MENKLFLKELGNFKYVMLFMLIPICNLWLHGFVAGAVWMGILVFVVPAVLAYLLDRYEVGQHNLNHSPRHHYRQENSRPHFNHDKLIGGAMVASQLHQDWHESSIACDEASQQSNYLSHVSMDADFWENVGNDFSTHATDTTDDWSHFHSLDSNSSVCASNDLFDSYGINPANGLPMMDSALDIHGNMFGTNSVDDFTHSHTWDNSFDHHTSFDSTNGFTHHDDFSSRCMDSTYNTFDDNRY